MDLDIILNGTLTALRYADEILRPDALPYAAAIADSFVFQHNNARPRSAHLVESILEAESILDLNSIENIWDMLER